MRISVEECKDLEKRVWKFSSNDGKPLHFKLTQCHVYARPSRRHKFRMDEDRSWCCVTGKLEDEPIVPEWVIENVRANVSIQILVGVKSCSLP
jgi:hypothetical protein